MKLQTLLHGQSTVPTAMNSTINTNEKHQRKQCY